MKEKRVTTRITICAMFALFYLAVTVPSVRSYPPFLNRAKALGLPAKDCTYCHVNASGGQPLNERAKWLIAEKARRGASKVDIAWLKEYPPDAEGTKSGSTGGNAAPANKVDQKENTAAPAAKSLRDPDVIYVPTPQEVVDEMLRIADVKKGDVLYDLGSGDGRIVITAAQKYGVRGTGIDIDPERIREANENAQKAGVTNLVRFLNQDLFETDISEATVVTLYLLESLNLKLRPKLMRELKPGTRIVSHAFSMGDWKPEKTVEVNGKTIYFWTIPAGGATKN